MSQITIHLGAPLTGDRFTIVCRWTDDNGVAYAEEIIIENDDNDLLISYDDKVLLRMTGVQDNREQ
jgi:hypothetical protein